MLCIVAIIFLLLSSPIEADTLRVVSLYPGHSDNIYAMGGGSMLVALSENDDDDLLPSLPRVSLRSGAEKLLSLRPDVVITRSFAERINPNLYDVLRRAGVKVLVVDPPEWDNFPEYLKTLAEALNLNPDDAIAKLNAIISCIRARALTTDRPRVFLEATSRELHTCAGNSWADRLIDLAGGVNIAGEAKPLRPGSSIAAFGVERVLKSAGNIDIYLIQTGAMNNSHTQDFYAREWTKVLRSVKVAEIPERYISRPSLLGLERGGNELIKIFRGE